MQNQKYHFFDLTKTTEIDDLAFFADGMVPDYNEQVKCPDSNCWALIIEQCSGLKDKYNNLIYEGDVVYDDGFDGYGEVLFDEGKFQIEIDGGIYDLDECLPVTKYGNIHQNPELLND